MNPPLTPTTLDELAEAVCSAPRVLAIGAHTKPRLSEVGTPGIARPESFISSAPSDARRSDSMDGVARISTTRLRGIVEYDPSEFTFTALAGTPIRQISTALAERGQHLPFDPMLRDAGATLGGTVASGLSGPGRFRYGGVRDFILGVRFVDGTGRLLRMGGKVVKNAAGFDLPKFFVGSLGRFGVLGEITFKVFPSPADTLTLRIPTPSGETAATVLTQMACSRWELDALDIPPDGTDVLARLAGPAPALRELAHEILATFPGEILTDEQPWPALREFRWAAPGGVLVKIALSPTGIAPLLDGVRAIGTSRIHISAGGNVAYVSVPPGDPVSALDQLLQRLALAGVTLWGIAPLWLGKRARPAIASAVKLALDPTNRFPSIDD